MTANDRAFIRKAWDEGQALAILQLLASEVFKGKGNDSVLLDGLEGLGFCGTRDQLRTALSRLESLGLLRTEKMEAFGDSYMVASITEEGEDIVQGKQRAEGVSRPSRS